MSDNASRSLDSLPPHLVREMDQLCNRFEAAWRNGERPVVDAFLIEVPEEARQALRHELARLDSFYRGQAESRPGEPTVDERSVASTAALPPGRCFGDYEILEEIAHGGMGIVYKARQIRLNRIVALKMIRAGEFASTAEIARFRAEAEAAAHLEHPNIVPIYEVGEHDGHHYFSMKLFEGGNLSSSSRQLPVDVTAQRRLAHLMATVARAVHHAHQRGILHRDLKPANILLDFHGQPHVTDFGLAKRVEGDSGLTQAGAIVGTPSYMAPEQTTGQGMLTTAVDIYGLGAILYELLGDQPPFKGATPFETLLLVRTDEPVRPSQLNPAVHRDLETICLKCLEKQTDKRYDSALALAEDLERWLGGEPIQARPIGRWERIVKWARRQPAIAALWSVSGLALLALVGLGVAWSYQGQLQDAFEKEAEAHQGTEKAKQLAHQRLRQVEVEQGKTRAALLVAEKARTQTQQALQTAEKYLKQVKRLEYIHSILLAHQAWKDKQIERFAVLLNDCEAEHRGWEWNYLSGLRHSALRTWSPSSFGPAAFSPDGRLLASGGFRSMVRILEVSSGKIRHTLAGHTAFTTGMAYSADGRFLASGSHDQTIRIWDTATGKAVHCLTGHTGSITGLAFSPSGNFLASASVDSSVRVWDPTAGKVLHSLPGEKTTLQTVSFSSDGRFLASGSDEPTLRVWETATGKPFKTLQGSRGCFRRVLFVPKSVFLLGVGADNTIRIWSLYDARPHVFQDKADPVSCVACSPDRRFLACGGMQGPIQIWEMNTGKRIHTFLGHTNLVNGVAFSPDSRFLASSSNDNTLRIWELDRANLLSDDAGPKGTIRFVAYSPDGRFLAGGNKHTLRIWDASNDKLLYTLAGHTDDIASIAFSPDNRSLAGACKDRTVRIWDTADGELRHTCQAHTQAVLCLSYSPDGRFLASGSKDGTIRIWDAATGHHQQVLPAGTLAFKYGVDSVSYSPDGRFLACGGGGAIRIWDCAARRWGQSLKAIFDGNTLRVTYSPDGRFMASCGGRTVRIWDVASSKLLHTLQGHTGPVQEVAFCPDSKRLVSISYLDTTPRLWDVKMGKEVLALDFKGHQPFAIAFHPQGRLLTIGTSRGLIHLDGSEPTAQWLARRQEIAFQHLTERGEPRGTTR